MPTKRPGRRWAWPAGLDSMAILVGRDTRLLVQGITGYQGMFHTGLMLQAGTQVVAGVTPGKGGTKIHDVPVFETVDEAVREAGANASVIFVPARFAHDAALESIASRLNPVVIITEGMPVHDAIEVVAYAGRQGVRVLGPNGPGVTTPGQCRVGIMPTHLFTPGHVGVVSRSGTLTYEIVAGLTRVGLGQSTAVGLGGDPVVGMSFVDALALLNVDPDSILIGNGSDDVLTIVTRAFVPEGGRVMSLTPSYLLYQTLAEIQGARFETVPYTADWQLPAPWS